MNDEQQLYLVNGFLGSGKTTVITQAAALLQQQGIKTGVITNDQGDQLVDTRFVSSRQLPFTEVVNGCFCCNYQKLLESIGYLAESFYSTVFFC